jgi:hypothetical protein
MPVWKYKDKGIIEYLSDSVGFSVIADFDDIKYLQDFVSFQDTITITINRVENLEDTIGFFPYFPEISFQLISWNVLNDIVGFIDFFIETYTLEDVVGFSDLIDDNPPHPLTDSIGFDDAILGNVIYFDTLIDTSGFNDTPLAHLEFVTFILEDLVAFQDIPLHTGHIITWRGRTKISRIAYGGTGYGEVISYGDGFLSDISHYLLVVKNESETIVREEEIVIAEFDNPDQEYIYTWDKNETDNTTITLKLIFDVYQVDVNGYRSLVKTVNFCD